MQSSYKTYRFRIKDSSASWLNRAAKSVNFVWNYCNETSFFALKRDSVWLSGFDLNYLTAGSSKDLALSSTTIQSVCEEYATRRRQFKKQKLNWRTRKSLGWIPFKHNGVKLGDDSIKYNKKTVKFWKSRDIVGTVKSGSFSQDARGRWYVNLVCEVPMTEAQAPDNPVGIDLGLKDLATLSNGKKYKANRYFRQYERKLATLQKAGKRKQTKNLHVKIRNCRLDDQHKATTEIAKSHRTVFVGDLNLKKISKKKEKLGKSVHDAGAGQFRALLKYKVIRRSGVFQEVNEYLTTQTCSSCGSTDAGAPKGRKGLSVREWVCSECGSIHDRDVNAALNILRFGHESPSLK